MKSKRSLTSIIILSIVFIIITILVLTNNMKTFDDNVYNLIFSIRNNFFDTFFRTITKLGNATTILILIPIFFLLLKEKDKLLLLIVNIVSITFNEVFKHIIRRPRPAHLRLIKQGGFSYPSGHAMVSIALYGFLIYIVNKYIKNKYLKITLITLLSLIIIGIGISRIYVGVHYPSDVLSGYVLSILLSIITINLYKKYYRGN